MATPETVDARGFYAEYFGHPVDDLKVILPKLKESSSSLIWLAGDSSLDNKYWSVNHTFECELIISSQIR